MMEDTPSPARAGRLLSSSLVLGGRQRLDPELAGVEAAGEVAQQEERLGQHVVARHRLELGDVERGQDLAQRDHAGRAAGAAGAGRRHDGVAGVEQHGAAVLHVGVDAGERRGRGPAPRSAHRPVDQREERKLVARDVEADRVAGLERGALREKQRQALQAGLADVVHLGVAGDRRRRAASRSWPSWAKSGRPAASCRRRFALLCAQERALRRAMRCANACEPNGSAAIRPPARAAAARCGRRRMIWPIPPASRNTTSASSASSPSAASSTGPRRSCGSPT